MIAAESPIFLVGMPDNVNSQRLMVAQIGYR